MKMTDSDTRHYKGFRIQRCLWEKGAHYGPWFVQSYHQTGMPYADEICTHYVSLVAAKEAINEGMHGEVSARVVNA